MSSKRCKLMKDTCCICKHYHFSLRDGGKDFHIYDWCDIWKTTIPCGKTIKEDNPESGYDDVETGVAVCWKFDRIDNERYIFFKEARVEEYIKYNQNLSKK